MAIIILIIAVFGQCLWNIFLAGAEKVRLFYIYKTIAITSSYDWSLSYTSVVLAHVKFLINLMSGNFDGEEGYTINDLVWLWANNSNIEGYEDINLEV